jgi:exodeoxyribonuclease VII large subunit
VLARAIADSRIPVISAVGHEIDTTIADFAADLRVPTPSAAAELVVGKREEFTEYLAGAVRRMNSSLELMLERYRRRLDAAAGSRVFQEPVYIMRQHQQRVDELELKLEYRMSEKINQIKNRLESLNRSLNNLNPKRVLDRGYSILIDEECNKAVTEVPPSGKILKGIVASGEMKLVVK